MILHFFYRKLCFSYISNQYLFCNSMDFNDHTLATYNACYLLGKQLFVKMSWYIRKKILFISSRKKPAFGSKRDVLDLVTLQYQEFRIWASCVCSPSIIKDIVITKFIFIKSEMSCLLVLKCTQFRFQIYICILNCYVNDFVGADSRFQIHAIVSQINKG